jgi:hypothetical protein
VRVRRSDCERVTEREELVGRLSLASRLPQYLVGFVSLRRLLRGERVRRKGWLYFMTAIFTGAVVLAR